MTYIYKGIRLKKIVKVGEVCTYCFFRSANNDNIIKVFGTSYSLLCYGIWEGKSGIPSCVRDNERGYYILERQNLNKIEII